MIIYYGNSYETIWHPLCKMLWVAFQHFISLFIIAHQISMTHPMTIVRAILKGRPFDNLWGEGGGGYPLLVKIILALKNQEKMVWPWKLRIFGSARGEKIFWPSPTPPPPRIWYAPPPRIWNGPFLTSIYHMLNNGHHVAELEMLKHRWLMN